jgi:hypothetical protein
VSATILVSATDVSATGPMISMDGHNVGGGANRKGGGRSNDWSESMSGGDAEFCRVGNGLRVNRLVQ